MLDFGWSICQKCLVKAKYNCLQKCKVNFINHEKFAKKNALRALAAC